MFKNRMNAKRLRMFTLGACWFPAIALALVVIPNVNVVAGDDSTISEIQRDAERIQKLDDHPEILTELIKEIVSQKWKFEEAVGFKSKFESRHFCVVGTSIHTVAAANIAVKEAEKNKNRMVSLIANPSTFRLCDDGYIVVGDLNERPSVFRFRFYEQRRFSPLMPGNMNWRVLEKDTLTQIQDNLDHYRQTRESLRGYDQKYMCPDGQMTLPYAFFAPLDKDFRSIFLSASVFLEACVDFTTSPPLLKTIRSPYDSMGSGDRPSPPLNVP